MSALRSFKLTHIISSDKSQRQSIINARHVRRREKEREGSEWSRGRGVEHMKVCGMKAYERRSSHGCPSKCQSMGDRTCHCHAPAPAPTLHLRRTIACLKAEELVVLFVAQLEQQQQNTATTTKWQLHELFKPPPYCWSSTCDYRESCSWFSAGPPPARPNISSSRRVPCGQRSKCFGFVSLLLLLFSPRRRSCGLSSVSALLTVSGHEVDRT